METKAEPRKKAKKLDHLRIKEAENGGHVIEHHFEGYDHQPEEHVFGKGEGQAAHEHIAKHAHMPFDAEEE